MDTQRLGENFARVAAHGQQVALFFYSHLFLMHPELRDMFPVAMAIQHDRFLNALGHIVADAGDAGVLAPFLEDLGRDHRKFGAVAGHYPAVGESLIATLKHFTGAEWTPELERAWLEAYTVISDVMIRAASQETSPPFWNARVIGYERRTLGTAMLRLAPEQPLPYLPGQSVALECPDRPRLWRYYSIANAPRPDGTLDFHVSIVDGGAVSSWGRHPSGYSLKILAGAHGDAVRWPQHRTAPASGAAMSAGERRDLEAELAYLRTFSEVCRTRLRAYLDSLARSIEEWERAEKSPRLPGPPVPPATSARTMPHPA